jgi:hypothetical protein
LCGDSGGAHGLCYLCGVVPSATVTLDSSSIHESEVLLGALSQVSQY